MQFNKGNPSNSNMVNSRKSSQQERGVRKKIREFQSFTFGKISWGLTPHESSKVNKKKVLKEGKSNFFTLCNRGRGGWVSGGLENFPSLTMFEFEGLPLGNQGTTQ